MASEPQLEYYDSGIWVAHMLKNDRFSKPAKRLFDGLVSSNDRIVAVSHVVLLETIHVLRRKIVGALDRAIETERVQSVATSRCTNAIAEFIKYVSAMDRHGKMELYTPDLRLNDYCRQILLEISRQPVPVGITSKRYLYSGLGPADIEHAHLARRAGVSTFYTTDSSFERLNKDPEFLHVSFDVLEPESVGAAGSV